MKDDSVDNSVEDSSVDPRMEPSMDPSMEPGTRSIAVRLAPHAVRLAALWILAGAASKMFTGTPAELPAPLLALDIDPVAIIVAGVAVEAAVGLIAFFTPRVGAIGVIVLLSFFAALLLGHIGEGAETCGCFGGAMKVPAGVMLAADVAFLALASASSLRAGMLSPAAIRAAIGPFAIVVMLVAIGVGAYTANFTNSRLEAMLATTRPQPSPSAPDATAANISKPAPQPAVEWKLPDTIPEQVLLRPSQWMNKPLADTPLGAWVDTSKFPRTATLVFFYKSCNHCAALLAELAAKQAANPSIAPKYVLVQLPTPPAYKGKLFVDKVPEHELWVELPSVVKAYVMTPPWLVDIDGGKVVRVERIPWPGEKDPKPAAPK